MAIVDRRGVVVSGTDPAEASDPNPGLAIKVACVVATTANIVLSGLQTIDTIAVAAANRVLVKNQTDATQNGIYNASTGNWTRSTDANSNSEFGPGLQVAVLAGVQNGGKTFQLTTASPVVLGTSLITWQVLTYPRSAIGFDFDGGGGAILPNATALKEVPFNCTLVAADFFADRAASAVVDVGRVAGTAYTGPGSAASICAADKPTLAAAVKSLDTTLTGWTLLLNQGDLLVAVMQSNDLARIATLSLQVTRS